LRTICYIAIIAPQDKVYRRRGENLECAFAKGEAAPLLQGLSIESGVGVSGWTLANRMPLMNGNAAIEFGVSGKVPPGFTLSSGLPIPLESEFGLIGVLALYSQQGDAFQTSHVRALLAIRSRIGYLMHVDASVSAGSRQTGGAVEIQLGQLSEALRRESALSPPRARIQ